MIHMTQGERRFYLYHAEAAKSRGLGATAARRFALQTLIRWRAALTLSKLRAAPGRK